MRLLREFIKTVLNEEPRKRTRYSLRGKQGWKPWPEEALSVPYEGRAGVGPGEERLAVMLDGEVQGGSVSYDVVTGDGKKWEVKEPTKNGTIRPGTEGRAAVSLSRQKLNKVSRKLEAGLRNVDSVIDINQILPAEVLKLIQEFISKDIAMINKGEISKGRIERLYNILKVINHIIREEEEVPPQKRVELGDDDHSIERYIDLRTYVRLGQFLSLSKDELQVDDSEVFAASFTYEAFQDPDSFMQEVWYNAARASDVFGHTDGVILVHPDGYRVILKSDLDDELVFNVITQGTAQFKIPKR